MHSEQIKRMGAKQPASNRRLKFGKDTSGRETELRRSNATVRLASGEGSLASQVAVGVSLQHTKPKRIAHFAWVSGSHRLLLQEADTKLRARKERDIFCECMLACVSGVENFRRLYPKEFDVKFTLLEGFNLRKEFAIGFYLAAFKAVAAATRFQPEGINTELAAYGWTMNS